MTIPDPFAAAPDEPQVVQPEPAVVPAPEIKRGPPPPPQPSEGKIVQTFKEGTGFDSSWVVVHSDTVKDALAVTFDPEFKELLDRTKLIAAGFRGGSPKPGTGARVDTRQAPQGATYPPSWFPAAPDPSWVYKTGAKNGRVWHAWAPAEKGEKWQFHDKP